MWGGVKYRKISIILLSLHTLDTTRRCVESIRKNYPSYLYEIIAVNHAFPDELLSWLEQQEDVTLICSDRDVEHLGYNQGIEAADPETDILLLDTLTILSSNSLFWLQMGLYEDEHTGAAGSRIHREFVSENRISIKNACEFQSYLEAPAVLIRREAIEAVGLLDSRFTQGNLWAKDYGFRLCLAGWKNVLCQNSVIYYSGIEGEQNASAEKIFQEKYSSVQKCYEKIPNIQVGTRKFKITAMGMVKNAADVIETCIRANGLLVDNFVLLDNMCSDRTIEILEQLKQEGFDIEIIRDETIEHCQGKKMTRLIYYVNEKYHPDFIIPIDDDECVVPASKEDTIEGVRRKIECLPQNNLYYLRWKIYLPSKYDDEKELCVAKRQTYCYGDTMKVLNKIIIPAKLLEDGTFSIEEGNHQGSGNLIKEHRMLTFARMAHFPCRSEAQLRSKVLTGWTNCLAWPERKVGTALHWEQMYFAAKKGNKLSLHDMQQMTLFYANFSEPDNISINWEPVNLPEEAMLIKYTQPNEINPWKNYCTNVEVLAQKYAELLKKVQQ